MKAALGILVAALAVSAVAQTKPKPGKKEETPKALQCVVMPDDKVDVATATKEGLFSDFKGRRYYFCCAGCKPAFEKNPAKYAKKGAPSGPIPKKKG